MNTLSELHFEPIITAGSVGIALTMLAGIITWWIRGIPDRRRARTEADGSLRTDLLKRVADLEADLAEERRRCDEELRSMRDRLDGITRTFIQYQLAVARAVPPSQRSPEIEGMIRQLKANGYDTQSHL